MKRKTSELLTVALGAVFLLGFFVWCLCKPADSISVSERRQLAQLPELNAQTLSSGSFMSGFEKYSMDQFPLRDGFRGVSALYTRYVARQKDIDGIYTAGDYISRLEYPLDYASLDNAAAKFRHIYDKYLAETGGSVYLSVIPDKNQFMAPAGGYPYLDFDALRDYLTGQVDFAQYIDLRSTLELDDY